MQTSSQILSFLLFLLLRVRIDQAQIQGSKPTALIVFGDSIVDSGNNNHIHTFVKCNFRPYGRDFIQQVPTGRFSNGKIPTDFIASKLGIKELLPAYLDPQLTAEDLLTGVSFASGAAGYDNFTSQFASVLSTWDQLELFKEYKVKLAKIAGEERAASIISNGLYLTVFGTDDIMNTYFGTPFRRIDYDVPSYLHLMLTSASSFIQGLYNAGARKIGVVGLPPIGCLPSQRTAAGGVRRDCVAYYNDICVTFNSQLTKELELLNTKLPGSKIIYIDIYNRALDFIMHPSNYGFEVSTKGCCGTGIVEVSVLCNEILAPDTCDDASKFVFWDTDHPTEKAYDIISDLIVKNDLPLLLK